MDKINNIALIHKKKKSSSTFLSILDAFSSKLYLLLVLQTGQGHICKSRLEQKLCKADIIAALIT